MADGRSNLRVRVFASFALACCVTSLVCGCSDEPTAANALVAALPLTTIAVHDTTIVGNGSSTFRQYVANNGIVNLVGARGNYVAKSALTFYPSDFPNRDTALVYSATLTLRFVTRIGDSTEQFAFNVYLITRGWTEGSLTWDTLQAGFYDPTILRGSYRGLAGSDSEYVTLPLDTAMVRQWLATPTSTTNTKYGIILVPASGCTVVRGFWEFAYGDSASYWPTLKIIAGSPTGYPLDTATYNAGIDSWGGNIDNLATNPQLIYLQAGVDYRSTLNFDVSFLPKGAVINAATVFLQKDPLTSRLTKFTTDSTFSLATILSASDRTNIDVEYVNIARQAGTVLTYAGDMRRPVQIWTRGGTNFGVNLRPNPTMDPVSMDLLTFFNEQAPAALRPRLKITWSVTR